MIHKKKHVPLLEGVSPYRKCYMTLQLMCMHSVCLCVFLFTLLILFFFEEAVAVAVAVHVPSFHSIPFVCTVYIYSVIIMCRRRWRSYFPPSRRMNRIERNWIESNRIEKQRIESGILFVCLFVCSLVTLSIRCDCHININIGITPNHHYSDPIRSNPSQPLVSFFSVITATIRHVTSRTRYWDFLDKSNRLLLEVKVKVMVITGKDGCKRIAEEEEEEQQKQQQQRWQQW